MLTLFASLLIISCEKKIDGSSMERFAESMEVMSASMSEEKGAELEVAMTTLRQEGGAYLSKVAMDGGDIEKAAVALQVKLMKKVDGKTADEIIALAVYRRE